MNNHPYILFKIGDRENARGRALICVVDNNNNIKDIKAVIINGASLKENMYIEILEGRLILLDIFSPFFMDVKEDNDLKKYKKLKEVIKIGIKEKYDIITLKEQEINNKDKENKIELTAMKYFNIYRNRIYFSIVNQLANEIFHNRRRYNKMTDLYINIFKLAELFSLIEKSKQNQEQEKVEFYINCVLDLKYQLYPLNIKKIAKILKEGTNLEWIEIANYIDLFYLTLKKYYPLVLDESRILKIREEIEEILKNEKESLYEKYFLAILEEEYEKASELLSIIEEYNSSSQSLKNNVSS